MALPLSHKRADLPSGRLVMQCVLVLSSGVALACGSGGEDTAGAGGGNFGGSSAGGSAAGSSGGDAGGSGGDTGWPNGGSASGGESSGGSAVGGGATSGGASSGGSAAGGASSGGAGSGGAGSGGSGGVAPTPCKTRVTYGSSWIRAASHTKDYDDATGKVTWDGSCKVDSSGNSSATLSNGWKPYFKGKNCIIALDYSGDCSGAPTKCATRIGYGAAWKPAPSHPKYYDDVTGVVTWDGVCSSSGGSSSATLSNSWAPNFSGSGACDLAFRYTQCGGLYANPVVDVSCPDPGVMRDGDTYYMVCTPGPKYPIRTSKDLVHWTRDGNIFSDATKPSWGTGSYWAPELHKVGSKYIVYFSAKSSTSGTFAIGAASASSPTGPYTDIGHPLITEPSPGAIDAHYFRASTGKHYVLWKTDGNAVGQSTPIKIQELAANGLSVVGSPKTLIRNTLSWEGSLVEGPWMVEYGGEFFLFYSANGYATSKYAVGVAKSSSPTGTFTKRGSPILVSKGGWGGPGHGSVLKGPSGDWLHVYHSWVAGSIGESPGRVVLADRIQWSGGWPLMRGAPSSRSQPLP